MANVVTRLVVESKEYDSKIARATSGLTQFEKKFREVGGTLEFVEKEDLDFVKALGQMDTVASTATGKLGELKKAFTELSVQYKNLTDEEKKSPYGQALAGSLEQIKGRIGELGGQLGEVGKEMQGSRGLIDGFTDALGQLGPAGQTAAKLLKGAFGPIGIAIAAVVGIIHQVVEAFKRNENAMASAERAAAPFKAMWQGIQRIFDKLVPLIADAIEKISNGLQSMFQKLTDWTGKLANTKLGKKLGLDTVYLQLKKVAEVQEELTESNKKIADSENALKQARRDTNTQNTQSRVKIAEWRNKASDKDNYSADERAGYLEAAMKEEEKILQRNLALRQQEYDLIKLKNSLTQSGTEDLDAENAALNAITDAQIEYNEHVRAMRKQLAAARKEAEKENGTGTDESTPEAGSIAAQEQIVKDLTEKWKNATGEVRDGYKKELEEAQKILNEMLGKSETPKATKDAAAMWAEYSQKLEDTKARLAEFKAMVSDQSLTDAQHDWAKGMAESYQEELNKMLGITEETTASISDMWKETLGNMSTGVGAISTLGNAFNDLKGIGEDLASAFSGEMDAWDSLMTVFNSGISIMQTVMGVMEAINTLQQLSNALSDAKVAKQAAETTAVVSGKGAEAAAESAEAAASGTATSANTAEAAAGAGKAMAGIPIVGPVLAIAAIAAVLAAVLAATSKAKSAGNFSSGGIVPGNSYSGDNLSIGVNSQELVLNRAQTSNLAGQLQGAAQQTVVVQGRISGKDILLSANNTNRAAGGSRGYYTKVH